MTAGALVRAPASTSNLGSGFDCLGVALDLWLEVGAYRAPSAARFLIQRGGTLRALADLPVRADRLYLGFSAACRLAGARVPDGIVLRARSHIPPARGLGSSGAATLAGALAADALLRLRLPREEVLELCARIEGHADNVAASLAGGAVLIARDEDGGLIAEPLQLDESLAMILAVPDFSVDTAAARALLPDTVPHALAATAVARASALVSGLASGNARLLALGFQDVLHVPHRAALVPGLARVAGEARGAGAYGVTLSGSGPTVLALAEQRDAGRVADAMVDAWRALGIAADSVIARQPAGGCTVRRWSPRRARIPTHTTRKEM